MNWSFLPEQTARYATYPDLFLYLILLLGNISMATQHLAALRARALMRYVQLRAEFDGDPMLVDSEDYKDRPQLFMTYLRKHIEDFINISRGKYCELRADQTMFLTDLPNEITLHVCAWLLRENKSKGLESFSLTCRLLHQLSTDSALSNQYMARAFPWDTQYLYPSTDWTIGLIKRFLRYEDQQEEPLQLLASFVSGRRAMRMGFDSGNWVRIIEVAIKLTQGMQTLQDNNPDYRFLQWMPFPWLVALHYTSLVFGRKFMSVHGHKLLSINLEEDASWERRALRHIFPRDGAVEAMKMLYWDSQPESVFYEMVRNFKQKVLLCSTWPDASIAPLWLMWPESWIHQEIQGNKDSWLRESRGGVREEAWMGTGFKSEDRGCILACLHNWSGGVPEWLW